MDNSTVSIEYTPSGIAYPTLNPTIILNSQQTGRIYIADVPFTSQSPFGDWKDPRQQDGCEEASALMVLSWVKENNLTKQEALNEILAISEFEINKYGSSTDTSTDDTIKRIYREYLMYNKIEKIVVNEIDDLVQPLLEGKLVQIPANGKLLNNPNFTAGGPDRHNLIIRGYDFDTNEFITNDPGTRMGENYVYPEEVIFNSIRDYPSGDHMPIISPQKNAIIITK